MTTATAEFNDQVLGNWTEPEEYEVTQEAIAAYAAATNDDIPQHASGELAPPVFTVVPGFSSFSSAMPAVVPFEHMMKVLHGEQEFIYHRPIAPGTTVLTRSAPLGFHGKPNGTTVLARTEIADADGDPLVTQLMTGFIRKVDAGRSVGDEFHGHPLPDGIRDAEPVATVSQTFDADQTFRYSKASGDEMPQHLDEEVAKAVGLPGIIIHGLCTMAFVSNAVVNNACDGDPERLRRFAVRFAKVVRPEQSIETRIWEDDGAYRFETTSDEDVVVLSQGFAEVRS